MGFPPPQFGVPLDINDIAPELSFYPAYGVTPDNKYIPLSITENGFLNVNATFSGSITIGEIGIEDESSFIFGTSLEQPIGGVYQDTNPTLSPGQTGAVRLTQYRAFHTNARYADGTQVLPATEATAVSIDQGIDTLNSLVPSVYDFIALSYTGSNLTTAVYKFGGSGGVVVSTLNITYDVNSNIQTVTRV